MTHAHTLSMRASTAMLAVLALGTTPAFAQDAAPALDVPAASAPAPQPTIQLPTEAPAPAPPAAPTMSSQPVIQQTPPVAAAPAEPVPERTVAKRAAAQRAATAQRTAARAAAPVAPAAPVASAVIAPPAAPPAAPAAVEPLSPPAAVPAAPAPTVADVRQGDNDWLAPAAGIAALLLALGAGGWAAMRGRRRHRWEDREDVYETEPAHIVPEPEAVGAPAYAAYEPAAAIEPTPHPTAAQQIGSEELAPAPAPVSAAVTPSGPVPATRPERDALLEEMVAAPPDAENPFTSRKARLRRARLILQRIEHDQKAEESTPFDWRTYKPSTSQPAPATPPRVTA